MNATFPPNTPAPPVPTRSLLPLLSIPPTPHPPPTPTHHLAGAPPGPAPGPPRKFRQSSLDRLNRLPQAAAFVTSATYEVLAWNELAAALMEDFSALPRRERNLARRAFLDQRPPGQRLYGVDEADAQA